MGLTATAKILLTAVETGSGDFGIPTAEMEMSHTMQWLTGTAAGQADLIYVDEVSIASGANLDLDLAGVLARPLGQILNTAELVGIIVINAPKAGVANTTNLTIGGGTNPVTGYLGGTAPTVGPLRPGGAFVLLATDAAGLCGIAAGTADVLRINNSAGAAATIQLAILGRTVA